MTRPARRAWGLVALLTVAAPAGALAGVPDPQHCQIDHVIIASFDNHGASSGPAPCGGTPGFDVFVRDAANQPVPGSVVSVRFATSGTGIRPLLTQNPGVTVTCNPDRRISVAADASGHAVMVPRFTHLSVNPSPTIDVFADGTFIGSVYALGPDFDGDGYVGLNDYTRFVSDYNSTSYQYEIDFDDCPGNKLGDFSFFAEQYLWEIGRSPEAFCN